MDFFNIITSFTSIFAILISCYTVYSSKKQQFEINKGVISVYLDFDPVNSKAYLIIKNTGNSLATVLNISCDFQIKPKQNRSMNNNSIIDYYNYTLFPKQKLIQEIDFKSIDVEEFNFYCSYKTLNKIIKSSYKSNVSFVNDMIFWSPSFDNNNINKDLECINKSILLIAQKLD